MGYLSTVAAGNQAKLMVKITSEQEFSPSALALAIDVTYTRGHLICMCGDQTAAMQMTFQLEGFGLGDVVDFIIGELFEATKEFKDGDFAVVDTRIDDYEQVMFDMDMNPNGSMIVLINLFHQKG